MRPFLLPQDAAQGVVGRLPHLYVLVRQVAHVYLGHPGTGKAQINRNFQLLCTTVMVKKLSQVA